MALTHKIELMGIRKASFTPGGGTETQFLGIRKVSIDFDGIIKQAEGDDRILAVFAFQKGAKVSTEYAAVDLDTLKVITGGTLTDSGTTPNQTTTLSIKSGASPVGSFVIYGQITRGLGTGDIPQQVKIIMPKFTIDSSSIKLGGNFEDIWTLSFGGVAIPNDTGEFMSIEFIETAT